MTIANNHRNDLDLLKTISIIAVVFYHFGFLTYGYLGVDIFLVISGYLIGKSILKFFEKNEKFSFFGFIFSRIKRLLPVLSIACCASLLFGIIFMLPDDFENLSQSVVASLAFSNNILSYLTTKDYWNISNNFRPLMHTWYLGILFEFYIIVSLIAKISSKRQNNGKLFLNIVCLISILSLVLFLLPFFDSSKKFYLIPFRFFELGAGCFLIKFQKCDILKNKKKLVWGALALIVLLLFEPFAFCSNSLRLLFVFLLTLFFIKLEYDFLNIKPAFLYLGKISYSIFIWHQVVLALYRYCKYLELDIIGFVFLLVVISILSIFSYLLVEKRKFSKIYYGVSFALLVFSLFIYKQAGVVRDVPELAIEKSNSYRGMNAAYCDRIYSYDKDFSDDKKIKVLIIGNSFVRDFANVLLESKFADKIDMSYSFDFNNTELKKRIAKADYIFVYDSIVFKNDLLKQHENLLQSLTNNGYDPDSKKLYGIGTKNFGSSMGQYYVQRFSKGYFQQKCKLDSIFLEQNEIDKKYYGENFIDMISPIYEDGYIKVFNDDKQFISADGSHLTVGGGIMYSTLLSLDEIIKIKEND